ncbi:KTSC domain-containing protein [Streptacidiphilus sp. MAP5-3]|uniref:KTSC domain-containing protein n=1 Tax=unclassified Streptacidiphilus TaxID=2643834 RepID=UPI0035175DFD
MRRSSVDSSCLRAVGCDASGRLLELEFIAGTVYDYAAVPPSVHDGLLHAESLGRYFNRHIRGHFRYRRVS